MTFGKAMWAVLRHYGGVFLAALVLASVIMGVVILAAWLLPTWVLVGLIPVGVVIFLWVSAARNLQQRHADVKGLDDER